MLVDYLDDLATIDEKVNATDRFTELLISGENFGRSVLVMQYDPDGIPVRLIPLSIYPLRQSLRRHRNLGNLRHRIQGLQR